MEKKRPFSKLKKIIDSLFDEKLQMEFCCNSYPIRGKWKSNHAIPRFYVKLNKEIIWDYPKDKVTKEFPIDIWARTNGVLEMVREFIDTPVDALLTKKFKQEKWECITQYLYLNYQDSYKLDYRLTELFIAADRRLGKEKLFLWAKKKRNPKVDMILAKRFNKQ